MVTGQSTGRMGPEHNLPVDWPVTIDAMLNFDGYSDGDGHGAVTGKQTLTLVRDEYNLLPDKLISSLLAQMDYLKF